jgi:hypothetical protein
MYPAKKKMLIYLGEHMVEFYFFRLSLLVFSVVLASVSLCTSFCQEVTMGDRDHIWGNHQTLQIITVIIRHYRILET